jgi:hypothetical protein
MCRYIRDSFSLSWIYEWSCSLLLDFHWYKQVCLLLMLLFVMQYIAERLKSLNLITSHNISRIKPSFHTPRKSIWKWITRYYYHAAFGLCGRSLTRVCPFRPWLLDPPELSKLSWQLRTPPPIRYGRAVVICYRSATDESSLRNMTAISLERGEVNMICPSTYFMVERSFS